MDEDFNISLPLREAVRCGRRVAQRPSALAFDQSRIIFIAPGGQKMFFVFVS